MRKFQVANVKCENCANLIKNSLSDEFGTIEVDLSQEPRVLSVNIEESQMASLKQALDELNFSIIKEL